MHYALNPRVFIFSHYFHTGLRVATGVIGLTALVFRYTDLPTAMTVCIGALCTSQMDLPSPIRHKFNEMLASVLLCTLVTLLISLSSPYRALLYPLLVLVSFLASMMVVYGKKSLPLQFAARAPVTPYNPWPTLRPRTWTLEYAMDGFGPQLAVRPRGALPFGKPYGKHAPPILPDDRPGAQNF